MKSTTTKLLALLCASASVSSCTLPPRIAKAQPLEKGVTYEVRHAMDVAEKFPAKKLDHYYFMLDVPPHSETAASLVSLKGSNLTVRTTAYCHSESDHVRFGRLAATGGVLKFGSVCSAAADWSRYPVGTRFRISSQPGVVYQVDDYGSALVGSGTIDLYRPTAGSMNAWGVREVDIEIIQWGSFEDSLRLMRRSVHFPHVRQMISDIERKMTQASADTGIKQARAFAMAEPVDDFHPPLLPEANRIATSAPAPLPNVVNFSKLWMTPVVAPLFSM